MEKNILIALKENEDFPSCLKEKHLIVDADLSYGKITTIYPFNVFPV